MKKKERLESRWLMGYTLFSFWRISMFSSWYRGPASCDMLEPRKASIAVLALGGSVGTPADGLEAEVLVVRSFDELDQANFTLAAKGNVW